MPTLSNVYAKFGEVAEAAQLLETEIGNRLLAASIKTHGFEKIKNKALAKKVLGEIDRKTLGQLIHALKKSEPPPPEVEAELLQALEDRNRLNHAFYREHNFRRNSEEGRLVMLADLEVIHGHLLEAYKRVCGFDIENIELPVLPTGHLKI